MKIIKGYLEYITENANRLIADYEMWDILKRGDPLEIKAAIVQRPEFINKVDKYDHSPLWHAVRTGSLSLVKFMILKGATINNIPVGPTKMFNNSIGDAVDSALSLAVTLRKNDIAKLLIENGAGLRVNNQNDTLLHVAAEARNLEIAKIAISLGPQFIKMHNRAGYTPLHNALLGPRDLSIEMIKLLLENDADPNEGQTYSEKETPFRKAFERASGFKNLENRELHKEAIKLLIDNGGDLLKAFTSYEDFLKVVGDDHILPPDYMEAAKKKFRSREIRKDMF